MDDAQQVSAPEEDVSGEEDEIKNKFRQAIQHDPLLDCLVFLTKFHGHPRSADSLMAGLPLSGEQMTPKLFLKAAERADFHAAVIEKKFSDLSKHVFPVILSFSDETYGVLLDIQPDGLARIMLPELGGSVETLPVAEIEEKYAGFALLIRPKYRLDRVRTKNDIPKPTSWFWGALYKHWWSYAQVGLAAIFINMFALVSPIFTMTIYDRVVPNNAVDTLWVLASGVTVVIIFDLILKTLRAYFIDSAGKKADVTIACRIFDQVLDMRMEGRPGSAGAFANTLKEFESLREFFTSATLVALVDLPFIFIFVFVIWLISGPVALVLLVTIPVVLIYGALIQIPLRRVVQKNFKETEQRHGVLVETINGLETIKSIGAEARMRELWEGVVGLTARSSQKARALSTSSTNFTSLVMQLNSVAVMLYGVYLIAEGEITVGALIACVMLSGRALAPLGQVSQLLTRLNQSMASLKALNDIMKAPVERPVEKQFVHRPQLSGAYEFKDVTFAYPGRDDQALQNISFQIKAGEKIGIIGRVGSGKSTVAKLMLGLYEPTEGSVMIDETDLRQIDPADLRRNIGYVSQDAFLFRGTIRDNITASAPYEDDQAILEAAELAGITEFVGRNSVGFDLPVGERGEGLSGGQRQAITIARALLQKPNILIFDEPTSSMDSRSELVLKKCLEKSLGDRSFVMITHRASLLSFVDRVIVLDGGKIVADGDKDQIMDSLAAGKVKTADNDKVD